MADREVLLTLETITLLALFGIERRLTQACKFCSSTRCKALLRLGGSGSLVAREGFCGPRFPNKNSSPLKMKYGTQEVGGFLSILILFCRLGTKQYLLLLSILTSLDSWHVCDLINVLRFDSKASAIIVWSMGVGKIFSSGPTGDFSRWWPKTIKGSTVIRFHFTTAKVREKHFSRVHRKNKISKSRGTKTLPCTPLLTPLAWRDGWTRSWPICLYLYTSRSQTSNWSTYSA